MIGLYMCKLVIRAFLIPFYVSCRYARIVSIPGIHELTRLNTIKAGRWLMCKTNDGVFDCSSRYSDISKIARSQHRRKFCRLD